MLDNNTDLSNHKQIAEDKKFVIHHNELPKNCNHCIETWPNSIYNTWNEWKDINWTTDKLNNLIDADLTSRIEIMLSATCNQTCMYCTENFSSSWANLKNIPIVQDNSYKQNVLNNLYTYISTHTKRENMLYSFLGGEPFLDTEIFSVIETIASIHKNEKFQVLITTNLNLKPKLIENYLHLVKSIPNAQWHLNCSLDTIGYYGEKIRDGLNFELFENNIRLLFAAKSLTSIRILPSVNCLSLPTMSKMYEWYFNLVNDYSNNLIFGKEYGITINYVTKPDAMSVSLTPPKYISEITKCIDFVSTLKNIDQKYTENHINHLKNMINLIGTSRNTTEIDAAKIWYIKQNMYKKINYFEIFPYLNEILTI
jgi:organic radical activating enzyme